jgi:preprotein translocase subunit SecY
MGFNLLHLMAPLTKYVPILETPKRMVSLRTKTIMTAFVLLVYLAACQIPLLGVTSRSQSSDSFGWIRSILASSRGTLM